MKKSTREAAWKQRPERTVGVDLGDRFNCALRGAGARIDYTSDSSMPGSTIVTQSESGPAALDGCTSG